jgi:hypothetical protein
MHNLPWILLRDFNILRGTNEITLTNPNLHSMIDFNKLIFDLQIQKLLLIGRTYIWSNKRPKPSFTKLDRVFLSSHWATLSSHAPYLSDPPTTSSNHAPLSLRFKLVDNLWSRSFQFEKHRLLSAEARDIIYQAWHSITLTPNIDNIILYKFQQVHTQMTT